MRLKSRERLSAPTMRNHHERVDGEIKQIKPGSNTNQNRGQQQINQTIIESYLLEGILKITSSRIKTISNRDQQNLKQGSGFLLPNQGRSTVSHSRLGILFSWCVPGGVGGGRSTVPGAPWHSGWGRSRTGRRCMCVP